MQVDNIKRNCPVCHIEYDADPKRLKWGRQTTCSRKCSYEYRAKKLNNSIECQCGNCGKSFIRHKSKVDTKHGKVFCSTSCQYQGRTNGVTPRIVKTPYKIVRKTKEEKLDRDRLYYKKRSTCPKQKIINSMRSRLCEYLKQRGYKKDKKTFSVIGCTPDELRNHLESQFKKGMSWENYNHRTWHIDHIVPISSAKNKNEIYKLSHYTNLQPLWAEDNYKKSNKITKEI
jgi:hypothetical protein